MVKYVVPDNPRDRLALNKNRKWVPVYEENLQDVAKVLGRLILKGEASPEEIAEFNSLPRDVIDNLPNYDDMVR